MFGRRFWKWRRSPTSSKQCSQSLRRNKFRKYKDLLCLRMARSLTVICLQLTLTRSTSVLKTISRVPRKDFKTYKRSRMRTSKTWWTTFCQRSSKSKCKTWEVLPICKKWGKKPWKQCVNCIYLDRPTTSSLPLIQSGRGSKKWWRCLDTNQSKQFDLTGTRLKFMVEALLVQYKWFFPMGRNRQSFSQMVKLKKIW